MRLVNSLRIHFGIFISRLFQLFEFLESFTDTEQAQLALDTAQVLDIRDQEAEASR